jgi:hypothetical protein
MVTPSRRALNINIKSSRNVRCAIHVFGIAGSRIIRSAVLSVRELVKGDAEKGATRSS